MEVKLDWFPATRYKGYVIEIATGIGGYHASVRMDIDEDTAEYLEISPKSTKQSAIQSARNTIDDTLFARGFMDEPRNGYTS